eukprot:12855-Heterococcus_DN1.PRE.2
MKVAALIRNLKGGASHATTSYYCKTRAHVLSIKAVCSSLQIKKKNASCVGTTSRCIIAATTTSAVAAAGLCASCCVNVKSV